MESVTLLHFRYLYASKNVVFKSSCGCWFGTSLLQHRLFLVYMPKDLSRSSTKTCSTKWKERDYSLEICNRVVDKHVICYLSHIQTLHVCLWLMSTVSNFNLSRAFYENVNVYSALCVWMFLQIVTLDHRQAIYLFLWCFLKTIIHFIWFDCIHPGGVLPSNSFT